MTYTPRFTRRLRDETGNISLWVTMPSGGDFNIWDLPEAELTPHVEKALQAAFERGAMAEYMLTQRVQGSVGPVSIGSFEKVP